MRHLKEIIVLCSAWAALCIGFNPDDYCRECVVDKNCKCSQNEGYTKLNIVCDGNPKTCAFPTLYTDATVCASDIPLPLDIQIQSYCFDTVPTHAIKLSSNKSVSLKIVSNSKLRFIDPEAFSLVNATIELLFLYQNAFNEIPKRALQNARFTNNVTLGFVLNNISSVADLPQIIENFTEAQIYFSSNHITTVPIFQNQQLFLLDTTANKVETLYAGNFVNFTASVLIFSNNQINTIEAGAFVNCNIGYLVLNSNEITYITADAFVGSVFHELSLVYNQEFDLELNAFKDTQVTNLLDLSRTGQNSATISKIFQILTQLLGPNENDPNYKIDLSYNKISELSEFSKYFKTFYNRLEVLGMRISEINLQGNRIEVLHRNAFADFSGGNLRLIGNPTNSIEMGTFVNLTLDSLRLSLTPGNLTYSEILIDCNISEIYIELENGEYYDLQTYRCFNIASNFCSKTFHMPLCTDLLELLECEHEIDNLELFLGNAPCSSNCQNQPVTLQTGVHLRAVGFNAYDYMDDSSAPASGRRGFTCFDASKLQSNTFYFKQKSADLGISFCTASLRSISLTARVLKLQWDLVMFDGVSNPPVEIPEVLLEFSQLEVLNLTRSFSGFKNTERVANIICTCPLAVKFYTLFCAVNVIATCQDGSNATEWVLANYKNCSNDVLSILYPPAEDDTATPFVNECDWCNITIASTATTLSAKTTASTRASLCTTSRSSTTTTKTTATTSTTTSTTITTTTTVSTTAPSTTDTTTTTATASSAAPTTTTTTTAPSTFATTTTTAIAPSAALTTTTTTRFTTSTIAPSTDTFNSTTHSPNFSGTSNGKHSDISNQRIIASVIGTLAFAVTFGYYL